MLKSPALRITVVYIVFASLWISFSDRLVLRLAPLLGHDPVVALTELQTLKGWLFVAVTGLLLYGMLRATLARLARIQAEQQRAEARTAHLLASLPHGVEEVDCTGAITYSNPAHAAILGFAPGELLGRKIWDVLPDPERGELRRYFQQLTEQSPAPRTWEGRNRRKDGTIVIVRVDWSYLHDDHGAVTGFTAVLTDVTAQRRAETALVEAAAVFRAAAEAIVITDPRGRVRRVNRAFEDLTGFDAATVTGKPIARMGPRIDGANAYGQVIAALRQSGRWQGELSIRARDGSTLPGWVSVTVVEPASRQCFFVVVFTDLRALKESQQQLTRATYFDALTGLPNRPLFDSRLAHALEHAGVLRRRVAVVILNLDQFRKINDSLGEATGNAILRQLGQRLRNALDPANLVARIGGNEFAMILEDVANNREVAAIAEQTLAIVAEPYPIDGRDVFCTGSIGIAFFPDDANEATLLVRDAQTAMYRAREAGQGKFEFYSAEFTSQAFERWNLEVSLRHALERNELVVYYQPQVTAAGKVIGCEALVRWNHPEWGLVPPDRFIPLAEENGIINGIGQFVLDEACRQARAWSDAGHPLRMAVNVSGKEFARPDLARRVEDTIDARHLAPSQLELEITETVFMSRSPPLIENLQGLRERGICLAIDDFGTGYSSLSYLKSLPVHRLKVDQSFVRGLTDNPNDRAIIEAIVALGHSLQLAVIAEGVETEAQRDFLTATGCDELQGYLYSPPLPADAFLAWLNARPS